MSPLSTGTIRHAGTPTGRVFGRVQPPFSARDGESQTVNRATTPRRSAGKADGVGQRVVRQAVVRFAGAQITPDLLRANYDSR